MKRNRFWHRSRGKKFAVSCQLPHQPRVEALEDRRLLCSEVLSPGPIGPRTLSGNLEYCLQNNPGPDGQGVYTLQGDLIVEGFAQLRVSPGVTLRAEGTAKLDVNPSADPATELQIDGALIQAPVVVGPQTRGFIADSDIDGGSIELQDQNQVSLGGSRFFGDLPLLVPIQTVDTIIGNGNLFSGESQIGIVDSVITANQSIRSHNGLPYCVAGTVSIQNGAMLRVDPGTELHDCGGSIQVGGPGTGGGTLDITAAVIDGATIQYHEFSNGRIDSTDFITGTLILDANAQPFLTNDQVGQEFSLQVHPTGIDYLSNQTLQFAPDTPVYVSGALISPDVATTSITWRPVANSSSPELLDDVRIDRRQLIVVPNTKVTGGDGSHAVIVSARLLGGDLVLDQAAFEADLILNPSANGLARRSTFWRSSITIDSNSLFLFERQQDQNASQTLQRQSQSSAHRFRPIYFPSSR